MLFVKILREMNIDKSKPFSNSNNLIPQDFYFGEFQAMHISTKFTNIRFQGLLKSQIGNFLVLNPL